MTILEALKSDDYNLRISSGDRWLLWDSTTREWVVYERKYRAKNSKEIYRGRTESVAVANLMVG